MSILSVIVTENPILRTKTKPVDLPLSYDLQKLVRDMVETMISADGVGIAAPQVGRKERICVIREKNGYTVLVNPEITSHSLRKEETEEGCLSIPGTFGMVKRHKNIHVKAYSTKGDKMDIRAGGFLARVIQHEVDHLDGILFTDHTKRITRRDEHPNPSYATK